MSDTISDEITVTITFKETETESESEDDKEFKFSLLYYQSFFHIKHKFLCNCIDNFILYLSTKSIKQINSFNIIIKNKNNNIIVDDIYTDYNIDKKHFFKYFIGYINFGLNNYLVYQHHNHHHHHHYHNHHKI
jgi:hypothetical protein